MAIVELECGLVAKAESKSEVTRNRKPYLYKSRHLHTLKRERGSGGQFQNSKKDENRSNEAGSVCNSQSNINLKPKSKQREEKKRNSLSLPKFVDSRWSSCLHHRDILIPRHWFETLEVSRRSLHPPTSSSSLYVSVVSASTPSFSSSCSSPSFLRFRLSFYLMHRR
ncbi:unnamed protein product [Vicia faba]|uniref:Nuclear transcription factor Y subunit n=1 Tax=Vicia faba TaxID=3906 RepID=A0AAV1AIR7_VICFA|nr:unnamed protein product [Vicia faba]